MRIRDFGGADFEAASKLLGRTRHATHGERSYWQGADELCECLARSDGGYVLEDPSGSLVGILLLMSPDEAHSNADLRSHWLQQRTTIAVVCRTLGIDSRADVGNAHTGTSQPDARIAELYGTEADKVVLLQTDPEACADADVLRLLRSGVSWLVAHGLEQGKDEPLPILPSDVSHNDEVGQLLDAYGKRHDVAFVPYDYHIERDGTLVAGIMAWAMCSELHIDQLAVAESERRGGLGARLLAHVEELARQDGCTTASVDTFSFQAPDYYPAHGYEEIFRYRLDDGSERIYFRKRL